MKRIIKISLFIIITFSLLPKSYAQQSTISAQTIKAITRFILRTRTIDSISTDPSLSANADNVLSTEKAVKAYVDAHAGGTDSGVVNDYGLIKNVSGTTIFLKVDTSTLKAVFGSPAGGVNIDAIQNFTGSGSVTVTNGDNIININPASPITTAAATLPTSPHNSNDVYIVIGGTITSGNVVSSSLTVLAPGGSTIISKITINGTADAGDVYRFHKIGTIWYRYQ